MLINEAKLTKLILEKEDEKTLNDIQILLVDLRNAIPNNHVLSQEVRTALSAISYIDDAFSWDDNDNVLTYLIHS